MSNYVPTGYTPSPPTYTAGSPGAFDIAGISAAIDRAASSLQPDERGSLTIQLDDRGVGAGLIVRGPIVGPVKTRMLATVTKPRASRVAWGVAVQASFLYAEEPKPVRVAPELRGLYRLFRQRGHGVITSAVRAIRVNRGFEVRLGR